MVPERLVHYEACRVSFRRNWKAANCTRFGRHRMLNPLAMKYVTYREKLLAKALHGNA
jgi:hypothetical protein